MAVTEVMSVSEYGMNYQKMRADAATINIANANVVQPAGGEGFKPLMVVKSDSSDSATFDPNAFELKAQNIEDKKVFQPEHAAADSLGFVRFANVDLAEQMITLTLATRAYEANVKAFNSQMNMSMKAMEIGK